MRILVRLIIGFRLTVDKVNSFPNWRVSHNSRIYSAQFIVPHIDWIDSLIEPPRDRLGGRVKKIPGGGSYHIQTLHYFSNFEMIAGRKRFFGYLRTAINNNHVGGV